MWNPLKSWFAPRPNLAEQLLNRFDGITGSEPRYKIITEANIKPAVSLLIYNGFPAADALTGITFGHSLYCPPDHMPTELTISMRDSDDWWAVAVGHLAYELRDHHLKCGDTVNYGERISKNSEMTDFLIAHPQHFAPRDAVIELGNFQLQLLQLIPIYAEERLWLHEDGHVREFHERCDSSMAMNPRRVSLVPN